ncbi:MAG: AraC family transcriptional regulator [Lentisphaeria bacterium]|nr:MAG: AraC family transcriptional regulator [Lentisphaeria bacterium]
MARNSVRTEIHDAVNAASLYLEQHLTDNLTLEELAGHANMSRAHFCRCFKLVFGSSVWTWLTQRRLELAKQMLATTDLSLKEIAAECGFCSSSYFSRQFKRYLKTTLRTTGWNIRCNTSARSDFPARPAAPPGHDRRNGGARREKRGVRRGKERRGEERRGEEGMREGKTF